MAEENVDIFDEDRNKVAEAIQGFAAGVYDAPKVMAQY